MVLEKREGIHQRGQEALKTGRVIKRGGRGEEGGGGRRGRIYLTFCPFLDPFEPTSKVSVVFS